jgi:hypothetical protein
MKKIFVLLFLTLSLSLSAFQYKPKISEMFRQFEEEKTSLVIVVERLDDPVVGTVVFAGEDYFILKEKSGYSSMFFYTSLVKVERE